MKSAETAKETEKEQLGGWEEKLREVILRKRISSPVSNASNKSRKIKIKVNI